MAFLVVVGTLLGTGVAAADNARDQALELEFQLQNLSPAELTQADTYLTLGRRFQELDESIDRTQFRLFLFRYFTWIPVLGSRIDESLTLLDIGEEVAQLGKSMSITFSQVWGLPLADMSLPEAVDAIGRAISDATPDR